MVSVALIGPDGVGKTTIAKYLASCKQLPIKYVYMGDNAASGNYMLPTTRWLRRQSRKKASRRKAAANQDRTMRHRGAAMPLKVLTTLRKSLGLVNQILDEWYRQLVAFYFKRRGYIVLFDRHFVFDYYHFDIQPTNGPRSLKRKLHGWFLKHTIPEPDLVICLDAPAEVVFERKGEFSVEFLEARRSQYLNLREVVDNFEIVDANRSLEDVVNEVREHIRKFYQDHSEPAQG